MKNKKTKDKELRNFGYFLAIWFSAGIVSAIISAVLENETFLIVSLIVLMSALLYTQWKAVPYLP